MIFLLHEASNVGCHNALVQVYLASPRGKFQTHLGAVRPVPVASSLKLEAPALIVPRRVCVFFSPCYTVRCASPTGTSSTAASVPIPCHLRQGLFLCVFIELSLPCPIQFRARPNRPVPTESNQKQNKSKLRDPVSPYELSPLFGRVAFLLRSARVGPSWLKFD